MIIYLSEIMRIKEKFQAEFKNFIIQNNLIANVFIILLTALCYNLFSTLNCEHVICLCYKEGRICMNYIYMYKIPMNYAYHM
jgi:hypothetical protein